MTLKRKNTPRYGRSGKWPYMDTKENAKRAPRRLFEKVRYGNLFNFTQSNGNRLDMSNGDLVTWIQLFTVH